MSRAALLLIAAALAAPVARADAPSAAAALGEAEALVGRGDFVGASRAYRTALDAGARNAGVLYGLGTAALKSGDVGTAVWALERASRLAPGDEDVRFNLERALERVAGELGGAARLPRPGAPLLLLTLRRWQWLTLGLLALALVSALVAVARPRWRRARRGLVLATTAAWAAALASAIGGYGRWRLAERGDAVIVHPAAVSAREAPGPRAAVAFALEPGHRIRAIAQRDGHLRLRLNNGLEGWVESGAVAMVEGSALVGGTAPDDPGAAGR
ncbi:MAG: hypothetical protein JXR83_21935 [Deltaproteobacteria bacterium]|nr:hypothetical protein [Deltaproteobacteria bacterium]